MLAVGDLSPPHWDTVPIAQTLHRAAHGFPDHPLLGSIMPKIIRDVLKLRKCCPDGGRFRLQRSIASELRKALYPESIPSLIKRRFSILRPGVPYGSIDMDALKNFMTFLSVAWSTSILRLGPMHGQLQVACMSTFAFLASLDAGEPAMNFRIILLALASIACYIRASLARKIFFLSDLF